MDTNWNDRKQNKLNLKFFVLVLLLVAIPTSSKYQFPFLITIDFFNVSSENLEVHVCMYSVFVYKCITDA